jgi:hypothetical protein
MKKANKKNTKKQKKQKKQKMLFVPREIVSSIFRYHEIFFYSVHHHTITNIRKIKNHFRYRLSQWKYTPFRTYSALTLQLAITKTKAFYWERKFYTDPVFNHIQHRVIDRIGTIINGKYGWVWDEISDIYEDSPSGIFFPDGVIVYLT